MKIIVWKSEDGWRWKKVATNGERVATSGESFNSRGNAIRAAWAEAGDTDATVEVEEPGDVAA